MAVIKVRDKEGNIITVPTLSGESAYDIAVRKGYTGTEEEWIAQIQSPADWDAEDGITQILNKPTKLSQFEGELTQEEQSLTRERIGAGTSDFSGDYNDLANKTHWKEEGNEIVLYNDTIAMDIDGVYTNSIPLENINIKDIVKVNWNGTIYQCEVKEIIMDSETKEMLVYFGNEAPFNESYTGTEPFLGYPFINGNDATSGFTIIDLSQKSNTNTVKIYKDSTIYHKLDNNFLNLDNNISKNSKNPITSDGVYKAVDEVMAVANGKCKTYVFQGESDLNAAIEEYKNNTMSETNSLYEQTLKTGDVFLLKDQDVADYWWDDNEQTIVPLEARKFDIPTTLAELTPDDDHNTVSKTQITQWDNKSDFSGNYNDLTNKPENVSQFNNDSEYLITESDPTVPNWAKEKEKPQYTADEIKGLATVATTGNYNDLNDKTHWKENLGETILLEQTISFDSKGIYTDSTPISDISIGDIVKIEWDSISYECIVKEITYDGSQVAYIGSEAPFNENYEGTEPFALFPQTNVMEKQLTTGITIINLNQSSTDHNIKISKSLVIYNKLDNNYLNIDHEISKDSFNPISSKAVLGLKNKIDNLATVATTGSYNDLTDKLFYEKDSSLYFDSITWDGTTDNTAIEIDFSGATIKFQKVSDEILTLEQLKGSRFRVLMNGQSEEEYLIGDPAKFLLNCGINNTSVQFGVYLVSVALGHDSIDFELDEQKTTVIFPNTGTYFASVSDGEGSIFLESLQYENIVRISTDYISHNIARINQVVKREEISISNGVAGLDENTKLFYNQFPDEAKDYNNLQNKPCYLPEIDITWDGDTTDKTVVYTSYISEDVGTIPYYKISDLVLSANNLIGGTCTLSRDDIIFTITEVGVLTGNIEVSDGFYITDETIGNTPVVFCIQNPVTFEITDNENNTFTIDFVESGVYFIGINLNSEDSGIYANSLKSVLKQLDEKFIPESIQRKINFTQLEHGTIQDDNIYKLRGIKNNNIEEQIYLSDSDTFLTIDHFIMPISVDKEINITTTGPLKIIKDKGDNYISYLARIFIDKDIALIPNYTYVLDAIKLNGEWHGYITGEQNNDYNNLINTPVREATAKISWDGNISEITTVATSDGLINSENVGQELSYYLMSDLIVDSSKVLNGTFTLVEDNPHTFNTTQNNIFYSDSSSSGSFYLSDEGIGGTPIVYCINEDCSDANPLVFDATSCPIGAHTITFTKPGIYFIKYTDTTYVSGFATSDEKQLDEKFIPDSIQRKLDITPLSFGLCDEEGYIINYSNAIINDDITKGAYKLENKNGYSFMIPFQAFSSITPESGKSLNFKIPTIINSFEFGGNKDIPEYITISVGNKNIISGKDYILIGYNILDTWSGFLIGKSEYDVTSSVLSESKDLITSGAVYNAIEETKTFAEEIAEGKCKTYVFDTTIADTEENFKSYIEKYKSGTLTDGPLYGVDSSGNAIKLKTGDILLLVQTNLPDYWWDEEAQDVHELEMSKLDLSDYVTTTQLNNSLSNYAKTTDLNSYATKDDLTSSSNSLQNAINNISSIKIGETSYNLRILEGTDDGGQAGYITFVI